VAHAAQQMRAAKIAAGSEWAEQLPKQMADVFSVEIIGNRMNEVLRERFRNLHV
jgi:hypothetical protein